MVMKGRVVQGAVTQKELPGCAVVVVVVVRSLDWSLVVVMQVVWGDDCSLERPTLVGLLGKLVRTFLVWMKRYISLPYLKISSCSSMFKKTR